MVASIDEVRSNVEDGVKGGLELAADKDGANLHHECGAHRLVIHPIAFGSCDKARDAPIITSPFEAV